MTEKWKIALKAFLKEYEEDDEVIGALLCGSYANETNNEYSDIDVRLILKNSCAYKQRGCTEVNSFIIEYSKDPIWKIKDYMENDYKNGKNTESMMFAYGKILYDTTGDVKKLQDLALEYVDKQIDTITDYKLDVNNYYVYNLLDELKLALKENDNSFKVIYYDLLSLMYNIYAEYESIPKLPKSKVYKVLTNEEYRKKSHVYKLPEDKFIKLYLNCFNEDKESIMYKNISNLVSYYYDKQGGFNIRQFKLTEKL